MGAIIVKFSRYSRYSKRASKFIVFEFDLKLFAINVYHYQHQNSDIEAQHLCPLIFKLVSPTPQCAFREILHTKHYPTNNTAQIDEPAVRSVGSEWATESREHKTQRGSPKKDHRRS